MAAGETTEKEIGSNDTRKRKARDREKMEKEAGDSENRERVARG
jgi:hypothetical protein